MAWATQSQWLAPALSFCKDQNFTIWSSSIPLVAWALMTELMAEASTIRDAINPNEILFVVDAMIGQDAVRTAEAFRDGVGFDGVVLTKLDGDATRWCCTIYCIPYFSTNHVYHPTEKSSADFDIFYPDRMASRILGMGDVATLGRAGKKSV
jgi:signal recognition particle subunit SRP54